MLPLLNHNLNQSGTRCAGVCLANKFFIRMISTARKAKRAVLAILLVWLSAPDVFAQQPNLMLPIGHTSWVNYAEFSADGKRIVTASDDGTAKIWDAEKYILLADLKGHADEVIVARFSTDGKRIITASRDKKAKIWDAQSGLLVADLKGHTGWVAQARFSPDNKRIVTVSADSTAKIWDTKTGKLLLTLKEHINWLEGVRFSPNGRKIVTASTDNTIKIWDVETGRQLVNLTRAGDRQYSARFSPDGKKIVAASRDKTAKVWDAETGMFLISLKGNAGGVYDEQFSPDGKKIVTTSTDSTVKIWDAETGRQLVKITGVNDGQVSVKFSPDGNKIVGIGDDQSIAKIWDSRTGKLLFGVEILLNQNRNKAFWHKGMLCANFSPDSKKIFISSFSSEKIYDTETGRVLFDFEEAVQAPPVLDAIFSPDSKKILTRCYYFNPTWKLWNAETGSLLLDFKHHLSTPVYAARFSPDGKKIVTTSPPATTEIWDAESYTLLANLKGNNLLVSGFSPDGKKFVTASWNKPAKIWDAQNDLPLAELTGSTSWVVQAYFSADSKKILTVSLDSTVGIWEAQTGKLLLNLERLKGRQNFWKSVNFSPDGKRVITVSLGGKVKIWDGETGVFLFDLNGHTADITDIEFSPDGKRIVTASQDGTAKVWDLETGKRLMNLAHADDVISARYSPDGEKIVTSSNDRTARIWEASTGKLLADLVGHNSGLLDAQFSPDGKKIVTASLDHTCKVWNAQNGKLLYTFFAIGSTDYMVTDAYGRYDGTEAARKLLYFTCGTDVIGLDQVKDQLWIPNLAERISSGDSINAKKLSDLDICGLIPHVMQEKRSGYHFMITPRRGGLGETVLSVNGIEVKRYKPAQLVHTANGFEMNISEQQLKPYYIAGQQNPVTVKAYTEKNDISSRVAQAMQDETAKKSAAPNLYAVMIGVSDYKSPELQLKYPAKDAKDISRVVASSARKLLNTDGKEHVYMYNFTTDKEHYQRPEKIAIKTIFKEIGKKANANDILLIFFSGHGISTGEQKQFYFLTADASQASATDAPAEVGISTKELSEWMKPSIIKAQKRILIFDACNSGRAIRELVKIGETKQNYVAARNDDKSEQIKAIDKLNERSGFFILAASASNQNAYEMGRYSQGLLTYALLKAIKQQPDILEDNKYLNVSRWFNAAEKTVGDIVRQTGDRQEPQIVSAGNFNIGVVDQEVIAGIKLADEKPLFTASTVLNSNDAILFDNLGLGKLLDNQLNEISAGSEDNAISYVAQSSSPDAYSLSGKYSEIDDKLTVRINIVQNNGIKYHIEAEGSKDKLSDLVAQIVKRATEMIAK